MWKVASPRRAVDERTASDARRRLHSVWLAMATLAWLGTQPACKSPEPLHELAISEVEAYWTVDPPLGETQLIAPAVRFRLANKGQRTWRSIQATATFRRDGEQEAWSGAFAQIAPGEGQPLAPGESRLVVLRPEGEGRYRSTGPPEGMFQHPQFKDVNVEVFVRLGSSAWTRMARVEVERRIGSRTLQPQSP